MCRVNPSTQKRIQHLVRLLAEHANLPEIDTSTRYEGLLELRWLEYGYPVCSVFSVSKLFVRSDLETLLHLFLEIGDISTEQKEKWKLDKHQRRCKERVRYILLDVLRDCLGILDDLRSEYQKKSSEEWIFLLTLNSEARLNGEQVDKYLRSQFEVAKTYPSRNSHVKRS